jgi:NitT/TauT family transport system permease protein
MAAPDQQLATLERGLDELEAPPAPAPVSLPRRTLHAGLPPLVALTLLGLIWAWAAAADVKPDYVLPSPAQVLGTLREEWAKGTILSVIGTSLRRGAVGFLISIAVATPLGLVVARVRFVRLAIGPLLSGLQSLPSVAWVPAAIIWFGLSDTAIYFVVLLGAVPSIANGLVAGIDQVPPIYQRVGRVLGARGLAAQRHVLLPAALPGYLSGLKQGWAFSWRSLMAAELITFSPRLGLGLGQLLDTGRQLSDMSLVFLSILLILAVGVAVELLVFAPLERRVLRRRGLALA